MKKLEKMTRHQALRISHILFFCGLTLLLVAGLLTSVRTIPPALPAALPAGGVALLAALLVLAVRKVRCPHCGASLMLGGRLSLSLPPYCPQCGKPLDETDC